MSYLTDVKEMMLEPTGWEVKGANKLLWRAAVGISVGGGRIEAGFKTSAGQNIVVSGLASGTGLGGGGDMNLARFGEQLGRSVTKYIGLLKLKSFKTDLYRMAFFTTEQPSVDGLSNCDLVLTTISTTSGIFGGSMDYYAFYKKGNPTTPLWVWFGTSLDATGGSGASIMQFKTDHLSVAPANLSPLFPNL